MFGETPRNKMHRKMPHHSYPHKSYMPIFESIKLERRSLLCMRRNEFNIVQKSPQCRNFETQLKCPISYTNALHERFKFFKFSDYLPLN